MSLTAEQQVKMDALKKYARKRGFIVGLQELAILLGGLATVVYLGAQVQDPQASGIFCAVMALVTGVISAQRISSRKRLEKEALRSQVNAILKS